MIPWGSREVAEPEWLESDVDAFNGRLLLVEQERGREQAGA